MKLSIQYVEIDCVEMSHVRINCVEINLAIELVIDQASEHYNEARYTA